MKFKLIFLFIPIILFSFKKDIPKHQGMANVVVLNAYSQNVFGKKCRLLC